MKVAIMQPYFFPYVGYFQLIDAVDTFVFYDDVNFIKKGFINRNSILLDGRAYKFMIPCKKLSQNKMIKETYIDLSDSIIKKMLKTFKHAYHDAPFYNQTIEIIKRVFFSNCKSVSEIAILSVKSICDYLEIDKNWKISSLHHNASIGLEREARIIDITKKEFGDVYINMESGKELYDNKIFKHNNIRLNFLCPKLKNYKQSSEQFIPSLSIIDVLMFNKPKVVKEMLKAYRIDS
ncbi:WbqC family protein [Snuella sedimenti]|uniref:WbqC family protein n=1 Tax=Snuella sedimenti TaxID=2798802 RepID=A0A8J7LNG7_9FLAO|nr:WbqC family protein [Snuella sedimenti]MBJ6367888.1 WbqC family protein [Snuella sedimenti]